MIEYLEPVAIPVGRKVLEVSGPDRDGDVALDIDDGNESTRLYLDPPAVVLLIEQLRLRASPVSQEPQE